MEKRGAEHVALGCAIVELRRAGSAPISQEALAAAAGLDRTYVGGVERGERNIAYTNLRRIASALGVTASDLIALAERYERTR